MSLFSSLYTGVSGLRAYGDSMQVIGNNIANVSTVGFKGSRAEFGDLLTQSIAGTSGNNGLGLGVRLSGISRSFSQGALNTTDRLTDLGIDGRGFFVLRGSEGQQFYTRNGQFKIDADGYLVSSQELRVQGNLFDVTGASLGQGDLRLTQVNSAPRATTDGTAGTGVVVTANLDSREPVIAAGFDGTSTATANATSNFSTTLSVYDSLGNSHAVTVYFTKTQDATATQNAIWSWNATVDGSEVTGGTAGTLTAGGSGTVEFDTQGRLTTQTTTAGGGFNFTGATAGQVVGFNFGDAISAGGTGLNGTTQYASTSAVVSQSQDGFGAGSLSSIAIGNNGTVTGFFTNGESIPIAQIILADFANPEGLISSGNSLFQQTPDSGVAVIGNPKEGGLGGVNSFTLETSNVDLAEEFVTLVTHQRAFQANSRIITTVDQLLNDVVNLVR